MQRYVTAINSGALIATFSLAGVFINNQKTVEVFIPPAILFALGVFSVGVTLARAIGTQRRALDCIDALIPKIQSGEHTEANARAAWDEHEKSARRRARQNHWIQIVGLALFIIGIGAGLWGLASVDIAGGNVSHGQ